MILGFCLFRCQLITGLGTFELAQERKEAKQSTRKERSKAEHKKGKEQGRAQERKGAKQRKGKEQNRAQKGNEQSRTQNFFCLMAAWLNEGRCPGGRPSVSTNCITIEASVFCIEMTTVHAIYDYRIKLAVFQRVPFG